MIIKTATKLLLIALLLLGTNTYALEENIRSIESRLADGIYPEEDWAKISNPEIFGWSANKLNDVSNFLTELDTSALIIIDRGFIVFEWGDIKYRNKSHSVRKSFMNALYGIYVDRGIIDINKTLNELGIDDIPPKLSNREKTARIVDLLMARSGVFHPAAYETRSMRKKRPERGSHTPGSFWFYNNWDFNALLTILENEADIKFFEAFKKEISDPLEMQDFRLRDTSYYFEKDKSEHPAYLFRMTARDMGRFGLLYLRKGRWKNSQIISEKWVNESTTPHSVTGKKSPKSGYGYLFWTGDGLFMASGKSGQRIVVLPSENVVIVHTVNTDNDNKVSNRQFNKLLDLIRSAKN
jgi:CubicO group peptidase (beta-lactamase class C family)